MPWPTQHAHLSIQPIVAALAITACPSGYQGMRIAKSKTSLRPGHACCQVQHKLLRNVAKAKAASLARYQRQGMHSTKAKPGPLVSSQGQDMHATNAKMCCHRHAAKACCNGQGYPKGMLPRQWQPHGHATMAKSATMGMLLGQGCTNGHVAKAK